MNKIHYKIIEKKIKKYLLSSDDNCFNLEYITENSNGSSNVIYIITEEVKNRQIALYVGKVSKNNSIEKRLYEHFNQKEKFKKGKFKVWLYKIMNESDIELCESLVANEFEDLPLSKRHPDIYEKIK